jgi:hypothetical protein
MGHQSTISEKILFRSVSACLLYVLTTWSIGLAESSQPKIVPLGSFAKIQADGEHCSGYVVDLWRIDDTLLGTIEYCEGMAGDIPLGVIENQHFDASTGKISFTARLSVGMNYLKGGEETPSKDSWEFHGSIEGTMLAGALVQRNEVYPQRALKQVALMLTRQKKNLRSFQSLADWTKWTTKVLQERGPKW